MTIIDSLKFNQKTPAYAEGSIKIELVDPITGKVKDRVTGKNHAFMDVLFDSQYSYETVADRANLVHPWSSIKGIAGASLHLNGDDTPINPVLPYLNGNTVGYGVPTAAASGLLRGGYSAANEKLCVLSDPAKISYFFQYDFTSSQANGIIKNVGLTNQYANRASVPLQAGKPTMASAVSSTITGDGRFRYSIVHSTGVITKYDMYTGLVTTINVSALVGTTAAEQKSIGYAPVTGKYYIFKYSSTPANRRMFVFSDSSFSTLETTYEPTNMAVSIDNYPFYVYGDVMYHLATGASTIYLADFVANTASVTRTINYTPHTLFPTTTVHPAYSAFATSEGIWLGAGSLYPSYVGLLYDPVADKTLFAHYSGPGSYNHAYPGFLFPNKTAKLWGSYLASTYLYQFIYGGCALTAHVLDTPIEKTAANGMTVTYAFDVYW